MTFKIEDWERKLRTAQESIFEKMFEIASDSKEMLIICQIAFKNDYGNKAIEELITKGFEKGDYKSISDMLEQFSKINFYIEKTMLEKAVQAGNQIDNLIFLYENADNYIFQDHIYELLKKHTDMIKDIPFNKKAKIKEIVDNQKKRIDKDPEQTSQTIKELNKEEKRLKKEIKELNQLKVQNKKESEKTPSSNNDDISKLEKRIESLEVLMNSIIKTNNSPKVIKQDRQNIPIYGPKRRRGRPSKKTE